VRQSAVLAVGLNPAILPADNLSERKPLLPCPFSFAGALSPAFFGPVRQPRGSAQAREGNRRGIGAPDPQVDALAIKVVDVRSVGSRGRPRAVAV